MKILMVTNRVKTYALGFENVIAPLQQLGHEVYWAADFSNFIGDKSVIPCKTFHIDIYSYPFHRTNLMALKQIKQIIRKEGIEAVQCSTPIGGALGRIAAYQCGLKKIIYTAHGFLFFRGAPLINRTIYKWEEMILAHITDTLITINPEDYQAAQLLKLRNGSKPYMVHGAGVKIGVEVEVNTIEKRKSIGLPDSATMIISAGDLNTNKNNHVVIRALGCMKNPNVYYVLCGVGPEEVNLRKLAKECGVEKNVIFLGYRTDMPELMKSTDIFVMPSFREGVPRSILEAMDLGKPCVGSKTRGIADLIDEGLGGYICKPTDYKAFADAFNRLVDNPNLCKIMGKHNKNKAKGFSFEIVRQEYIDIYKNVL